MAEADPVQTTASTEFRAIGVTPDAHNGTVLLVEAYSFIWLAVLAFVWFSYRQIHQIQQRLGKLEASLSKLRGE